MLEKVLIIDFGSQFTQLIARRIRELNVYSEIVPYTHIPDISDDIKGIILSGSPYSVTDSDAPSVNLDKLLGIRPVLGICFGAQYIANHTGGKVAKSDKREYGRAHLAAINKEDKLFQGVLDKSQVWMSHGDHIENIPDGFELISSTDSIPVAAFRNTNKYEHPVYGVQFHPEVHHSTEGKKLFQNFINICNCKADWTPNSFVESTIANLKAQLGNDKVILGLSGGVDSSVAAALLHEAIGKNLYCIFIDNGLLRKNEFESVLASYKTMGLNVIGVNAKQAFVGKLTGIDDPEKKRKIIGNTFIEVFDQEAHKIEDVKWLAQGTIYPDVIESISVKGPSATIKSHHNVGGLPEKMHLKVVEPLRELFKDEVRRVGKTIHVPENILKRHPFPGPGLAIRILGPISEEKITILQEADDIFITGLKTNNLYDDVWQAGVMLLPVQSVGVMGDERTYEYVVSLRAVSSVDGMTADWCHLPYEFLAKISNDIINKVKGINRVVYDISSKPPATIEWE